MLVNPGMNQVFLLWRFLVRVLAVDCFVQSNLLRCSH